MGKRVGKMALLAGIAATTLGLAGCGTSTTTSSSGPVTLSIMGWSGWAPSETADQMGTTQFPAYAKKHWGLNVKVNYIPTPIPEAYPKATASLAAHSSEYNLIWAKAQWFGAWVKPHWIMKLNSLIDQSKDLKTAEGNFISPAIQTMYQSYPYGSTQLYGAPAEGDALIFYIRKDWLDNPTYQAEFLKEYGYPLPTHYSQWEHMRWSKALQIIKFFNRPSQGIYGIATEYSKSFDYMSDQTMSLMWSSGGQTWNPRTNQVYGILNSATNDKALNFYVNLLKYSPPGADTWGVTHVIEAMNAGKVFSAFIWSAVGPSLFTPQMKNDLMAIPIPGRMVNGKLLQIADVGGQTWTVNNFDSPAQKQAAEDFIKWWYLPSVQKEFAMKGGNAVIKSVVNSPTVRAADPWYPAYEYTMTPQHLGNVWENADYASLLFEQQKAWTALATGAIHSAKLANTYAACKQQGILYSTGFSKTPPPSGCANVHL